MQEIFTSLVMMGLYVAATADITYAMNALGRCDAKGTGVCSFFCALFQFLVVCYLFAIGQGIAAFNFTAFCIIFFIGGVISYTGADAKATGAHCIISTIMFLVFTVYWPLVAFGAWGLAFGVMNFSYAMATLVVTLLTYGKIGPKIFATVYFIVAFGTLLLPSILYLFNVPLP
jgi:hypothetical protein